MKIATCSLILCALSLPAQQSSFEVASVRLAVESDSAGPRPAQAPPGVLTLRGVSLRNCIQIAWEMPPSQVIAPEWLNDVRLDISAKAAGPAGEKQLHLMLKTLLAERLGVRAHLEKREVSVYALTVAKGGPKFSESTTEGPPVFGRDKNGPNMRRVSMNDLAMTLAQPLGRPVVDATGLKGRYDIRVDPSSLMPPATVDGSEPTPADPVGIMIAVLRDQMGLKVEGRKDIIDVLIVEHAEKTPVEN